jgi:heptosyltransferase-2
VADNILLVPKGFFGDILLITPVFEALKESDPARRVSVVCTPQIESFVRRLPGVDGVVVFDRKGRHAGWKGLKSFADEVKGYGFTHAYSFHRSPRTSYLLYRAKIPHRVGFSDAALSFLYTERVAKRDDVHDVARNLRLVSGALTEVVRTKVDALSHPSLHTPTSCARLQVPAVEREEIAEPVRSIVSGAAPYVVLVPGSAWETKRWDWNGFREVAKALRGRGLRVVVAGAPQERELCGAVSRGLSVDNVCGETTLLDMVGLVRGAAALVCNDSLALHIASATQTPTVAIFCATSPRFGFGPWQNHAVVVEKEGLYCKPCHRHGSHSCPNGTKACMTGVTSGDVLRALDQLGLKWNSENPLPVLTAL